MTQIPPELEPALLVDEVGIETGIYEKYRLKTAHQPIFRREAAELVPFAVEARVAPFRGGEACPAGLFEDKSSNPTVRLRGGPVPDPASAQPSKCRHR